MLLLETSFIHISVSINRQIHIRIIWLHSVQQKTITYAGFLIAMMLLCGCLNMVGDELYWTLSRVAGLSNWKSSRRWCYLDQLRSVCYFTICSWKIRTWSIIRCEEFTEYRQSFVEFEFRVRATWARVVDNCIWWACETKSRTHTHTLVETVQGNWFWYR